ncbi:class I SAM-dependent methyltransferase [Telmatobacter sp. DSM 110680]|uniref:Class I SAM-dependent methyltransferase n=1 Tax=Telmatobacter sp. DSM 110680 TaxID=3036704 RepID=A0AAU7DE44_9BACT
MKLNVKVENILRMLVQRYGSESAKRHLWNREFSSGKWNCLDNTGEESIGSYLEKYAKHGAILDLGCGTGATGIGLNTSSYSFYTGVDISDAAINKARTKAIEAGVADRREYCVADILTYVPKRQYNVICFGDSIYYIPFTKIVPMLSRYMPYLSETGVFAVRLFDSSGKLQHIINLIEGHYMVIEKHLSDQSHVCNIIFGKMRDDGS